MSSSWEASTAYCITVQWQVSKLSTARQASIQANDINSLAPCLADSSHDQELWNRWYRDRELTGVDAQSREETVYTALSSPPSQQLPSICPPHCLPPCERPADPTDWLWASTAASQQNNWCQTAHRHYRHPTTQIKNGHSSWEFSSNPL